MKPLVRALPILALMVVWEVATRTGLVSDFFLPPLSRVLVALVEGLGAGGALWRHLGLSLGRALAGLATAVVSGITLGILMARFRLVSAVLDPLLAILFPTPKLALFPLLLLWLGMGHSSKIALIAITCFFPVVINTYGGVRNADKYLVWNALTKGARTSQVLWRVLLPAASPFIFTGVRVAASFSFLMIVASEMIAANEGLGFFIIFSERTFNPTNMYAGIVLIAALGFLLDRLILKLQRRLFAWQDTAEFA